MAQRRDVERRRNVDYSYILAQTQSVGSQRLFERFDWIEDISIAGLPTFLANRVSTTKQAPRLVDQILFQREKTNWAKAKIVGCSAKVANGDDATYWARIATMASYYGAKVIQWESLDRAIRHRDWGKDHSLEPTVERVEQFLDAMKDFQLVTALPTDSTFYEVRKHQSTRGKGGNLKDRQVRMREALLPIVRDLAYEGKSYSQIGASLGIEKQLVYKWLKRAG